MIHTIHTIARSLLLVTAIAVSACTANQAPVPAKDVKDGKDENPDQVEVAVLRSVVFARTTAPQHRRDE